MNSTIKVFLAIVIITTILLTVFDVFFPARLGRFVGLVENVIPSIIGSVLITIALNFILRYRQQKSIDKVVRLGVSEIESKIILAEFSDIAKRYQTYLSDDLLTALAGMLNSSLYYGL